MHIPIINHKQFLKKKVDVAVLFAWNHKDEILKKRERNLNLLMVNGLLFFLKLKYGKFTNIFDYTKKTMQKTEYRLHNV